MASTSSGVSSLLPRFL
uniref:Uncharacterized protein n=1 Tax=Anguilla anguilla TaxID=7936 RepID=A0A0E9PW70_ANGAN